MTFGISISLTFFTIAQVCRLGILFYKENVYLKQHKFIAYLNSKVFLKRITMEGNLVFIGLFNFQG
jgi:hypothetical protein